jgi:hypothetical protein
MRQRKLGKNGPVVSALGLGVMGISGMYGPSDRSESIATIHAALDAGITLIDTVDSASTACPVVGSKTKKMVLPVRARGGPPRSRGAPDQDTASGRRREIRPFLRESGRKALT